MRYLEKKNHPLSRSEKLEKLREMEPQIRKIISSQDEQGRWVVQDRYRVRTPGQPWNGEYRTRERLSSRAFNSNVNTLCDYVELVKSLD